MYNELNKLFKNKEKLKRNLLEYCTESIKNVYDALLNNKVNLAPEIKVNANTKKIDKFSNFLYKSLKRKPKKQENYSGFIFLWLNKDWIFKKYVKLVNAETKKYENDGKFKLLEEMDVKNAFVLCSKHNDCAEDHKDWQGKIYVKQEALKNPQIKEYCAKYHIKTMEWVIGKPVYMITRPNCRHYFQEINFDELKTNAINALLNKYDMSRKIGPRGMLQTLNSKQKSAYEMAKLYETRLDLHKKMQEINNNKDIINAIHKDKMLLNKWKSVL